MIIGAQLLPTPPAGASAVRSAAPATAFADWLIGTPTAPAAPSSAPPATAAGAVDAPQIGAAHWIGEGAASSGGVAAPSRGFRFDELGMFGEIAAVYAPVTAVNLHPAATADTGSDPAEVSATSALGGAATAPGAPTLDVTGASVADGLATPPGDPVLALGADAPTQAPVETSARFAALDGEAEVEPASSGRPAEPAAPDADRPATAAPAHVAVHEADGALAVLASTTALSPADHERVWRETESYARELGLDLRELHLNGRTSSRANFSSRGGYGG